MTRVAVVGGGIAGLAAAHALAARGVPVTLLEATATVGGKIRVSEIAGLAVDEGAEAFVRRRPEGLELAAAAGLGADLVTPATTAASVWARGALRPIPARTVMGVPSDPRVAGGVLSSREVLRAFAEPALPRTVPAEGDVAVGPWIARRLGRAVVDRLVDPLLGGVYAGRADELSAAATLPQLSRAPRSILAAARAALPAPKASPEPVFATLRGGLGRLPAALASEVARLGGEVLTGRPVRRLERTVTGWRVVHGPTTDEQVLEAAAIIVAAPAAPAARLLRDVAPAAAVDLAGIETASMAVITTTWHSGDLPATTASGYLVPAVTGRPVKAVTFSSVKWAHLATEDVAVVRCSIGRYGDVEELQRDDAELVAAAVGELREYAGFRGAPIASRVSRWGGGLPQYAVGHLDRVRRIRAAVAAVPGLAVCGASYDGVGLPACIRTGRDAAATLLADHGVTDALTP